MVKERRGLLPRLFFMEGILLRIIRQEGFSGKQKYRYREKNRKDAGDY